MAIAAPTLVSPLRQRAAEAYRSGALAEAERFASEVLRIQPDDFETLTMLGIIAARTGRGEAALARFARAVEVRPEDSGAFNNLGNILGQLGRAAEAVNAYERAIALDPGFADAHNNLANALAALGRFNEALTGYDRAIARRPRFAAALNNRGNLLRSAGRHAEALEDHRGALALQPDFLDAAAGCAAALLSLQRPAEALACCDEALARRADHLGLIAGRAAALCELKRDEEALSSLDRAIALAPNAAELHSSRGEVLRRLQRLDAALASHDRAVALRPALAEAHNNRGVLLTALGRPLEAVDALSKAIALQPDFADALNNRAYGLRELRRLPEAAADFEHALALKPRLPGSLGSLVQIRMQMCEWDGVGPLIERLEREVLAGEATAFPFNVLALLDSLLAQRRAAETYVRTRYPPQAATVPASRRHDRIRVGYFSADFHGHATTRLMAELLEVHDRSRFELFGFSFGPDAGDAMRRRVAAAFDRFEDVRDLSDAEIAAQARALEIDIGVDLKGYTQDCRTGIFAHRAAPIQVSYLGYPGTMAAPYIDYLIADPIVVPEAARAHYSEKLVWLPDSYQVNDRQRRISDRTPTRTECGLPDGFVFCCFNNSFKLTPRVFDRWMRILAQVPQGVLWLLEDNPWVAPNLQREAARRGIEPARLVFAPCAELPEHLARHRLADLFLDTLPYNAHTTASDALWAGVPMLTCPGQSFASRVGASLLAAAGLPEMIAPDGDAYEAMAVALARDPERLASIRHKLATRRDAVPLFDTPLFARRLEAAFAAMIERDHAGLPPDDLRIAP